MEKRTVNGLMYRDGDKYFLVSFYDEKRKQQDGGFLETISEGGPLSEATIVLVDSSSNKIKHNVVVNLYDKNNKPLVAKRMTLDDLIETGYTSAMKYLKKS
jgi:hypothetical protein